CGHLIARDDLVVTALLLRVKDIASDREGRPTRSNRPTPHLDRRRPGPVSLDPHAVNDAVTLGASKAGPLPTTLRACCGRRALHRLIAPLGEEPFFRSLRPTPL